jgi:dimethyladenosine transferase (EC 2.1.1.-)
MLFMLQKEVVDRLVAAPGSADYGRLTVMLAAAARAEALFEVGPGAFNPPPRVRSAVVRIVPRAPDFALPDRAAYARVVAAAFSQRRKQIGNALRGLLDAPDIAACDLSPTARAETLTPADYARLALRLSPDATPGAAQ